METQVTSNSQAILSKKSNAGSITIPDKLYYRSISIKTACTGTKTDRKTNGSE
jgi:hypothetical protein